MQDDRDHIGVTRQRALGALVAFALLGLLPGPGRVAAQADPGDDTLGVRIEAGAGADITNEQYYEDAFIDSTFLGRRSVTSPETRYGGIMLATIQGTRGARRASYLIQNELSLGDKLQRDILGINWRDDFASAWRWSFNPTFEWRHDQTFDRDQQEWRAAGRARLRRGFIEATTSELAIAGDMVRSSGQGSEFLLDRNTAAASIALDHLGIIGDEWRIGYALAMRVFPDSSARDHYEHSIEERWRHVFAAGHALAIETNIARRQTREPTPTTRDNFWNGLGVLDGELRTDERWALRLRVEGEVYHYDSQDSAVFFDYQVVRARLGPRYEANGWMITVGPLAELLHSAINPSEEYRQIGGIVELEGVSTRWVWNATPEGGWREYDEASGSSGLPALHSSYTYLALDGFVDVGLLNRLRLRMLGSARYEFHTIESQNSGSLYASMQLLWTALR